MKNEKVQILEFMSGSLYIIIRWFYTHYNPCIFFVFKKWKINYLF